MRKEIGTNKDGSLGAFGGNKYEGLGVRDVNVDVCSNSILSEERRARTTT